MVVGLGNPGAEYEMTRHNVGFMVVEELASRCGASFSSARGMRAVVAQGRITASGMSQLGGEKIVLVKPMTYMNESGVAVGKLANFLKLTPDRVVVIHDELDIDFGTLRMKLGGGDNGHNGLKSIRAHLKTGDFYRVRFGIGRPNSSGPTTNWVLGRFPNAMHAELGVQVAVAADATESLLVDGLAAAQNKFNH